MAYENQYDVIQKVINKIDIDNINIILTYAVTPSVFQKDV